MEHLRLLDDALRGDIPGTGGWRSTPEEFAEETLDARAFNPPTYLVAVTQDTGECIGLVRIWMNRSGPRIGMFGVLRAYRRRGIALALLARCLVAARDIGHRRATPNTMRRTRRRGPCSSAWARGRRAARWNSRRGHSRPEARLGQCRVLRGSEAITLGAYSPRNALVAPAAAHKEPQPRRCRALQGEVRRGEVCVMVLEANAPA